MWSGAFATAAAVCTLMTQRGWGGSCAQPQQEQTAAQRTALDRDATIRTHQDALAANYLKIELELERLEKHEWAGRYSTRPDLCGWALSLAPECGFVYFSWSDIGGGLPYSSPSDANYGAISEVHPDSFRLEWRIDPGLNDGTRFSSTMYRITWGERRYIATPQGVIKFCNVFNAGSPELRADYEPRGVYLHFEDRKKPVAGRPRMPEEFQEYILDNPIECRIVEIMETRKPERPYEDRTLIRCRADAGLAHGLRIGMLLYLPDPGVYGAGEVVDAREDEATVDFLASRPKNVPVRGVSLSTRAPGSESPLWWPFIR